MILGIEDTVAVDDGAENTGCDSRIVLNHKNRYVIFRWVHVAR